MAPALGPIRQTAFVVDDADAAARRWATVYGVGPFFLVEADIPATYKGAPTQLRARIALAQSGVQQVELVEPIEGGAPSIFHDFRDAGGEGAHHVCFWGDLDTTVAALQDRGCELVQDGVSPTGDPFVYLTSPVGVPYVELVDPREGTPASSFFAMIRDAAEGWDGHDPVRRL